MQVIEDAYTAYWRQLVRTAHSITQDHMGAEDAAQEALTALWNVVGKGEAVEHVKAWLLTATRRKALDWVARRATRYKHEVSPTHLKGRAGLEGEGDDETYLPPVASAEDEAMAHINHEEMSALVEQVAERSPGRSGMIAMVAMGYEVREIGAMMAMGYEVREIGAMMGWHVKAAESRLYRLRQQVRLEVGRYIA